MPQHVRVLLFGRYAEIFGADAIDVSLTLPATVAEVVELVRGRPGGAELPARILCAVNLRQVGPESAVVPGDEVALLPPLAGG
jgi:molybdopterin converting factor small subunit